MKMSLDFLEDEVRHGFYIPAMMKRSWSSGLQILHEIDKVCRKYDIRYFAEWGTFLGTVRHAGFIPWDDDLDIGMMREDYRKFCKVALKELPEGYVLENFHEDPEFDLFLARVTSNAHISFDEEYLKRFNGFPYRTGVDIFVTDYIYADEEREEGRVALCKRLIAIGDAIHDEKTEEKVRDKLIKEAERLCHICIDRDKHIRQQIYVAVENIFAEVPESEASEVAQMFPWGLIGKGKRYPKECYKEILEMPYEFTQIPIPAMYDMMLTKRYGNYMHIVKNVAGHEYPYYSKQKKEIEETFGFSIPDFIEPQYHVPDDIMAYAGRNGITEKREIKEGALKKAASENVGSEEAESYKGKIKNILERIQKLQMYAGSLSVDGDYKGTYEENVPEIIDALIECQELAVTVGGIIEEIKGEDHSAIHYLEEYCEKIYEAYQAVSDAEQMEKLTADRMKAAASLFAEVKDHIQDTILMRKEIVFMPFKAEYWGMLEPEWKKAVLDESCDVYVVPIPYYYKNYVGALETEVYKPDEYPEKLNAVDYEKYDLELHHPDAVYIQNPYDAYNPSISVPPYYYSNNIRKYTGELVYIPYFKLDEFDYDQYCENYNMRYYCTMPGVVYADRIILQSENMKKLYVKKLTEFAGEHTRRMWEDKITVADHPETFGKRQKGMERIPAEWQKMLKNSDGRDKKVVCYYCCVSIFAEHGVEYIEKIRSSLKIFYESRREILLLWKIQPQLQEYLKKHDNDHCQQFKELLNNYKRENWGVLDMEQEMDAVMMFSDAYYGDSCAEIYHFQRNGMPVMIQNAFL